MADQSEVPVSVRQVIERRASEATRAFAEAFAEQAVRRSVELRSQTSRSEPHYFRVVSNGDTVAYVRPRRDFVLVEYLLPFDHWAYGWGFGRDSIYGIGLKIEGQTSFEVGLRLLDDAIRKHTLEDPRSRARLSR